jgi:DNA (cytosine-5)-methyltransferase 1
MLRVIELFAGIGSWAKALSSLSVDFSVLEAVELDKKTMDCYNLIHNTNYVNRDISDIHIEHEDIDLICYSPPCQSWSKGGDKKGFKDDRGLLFYESLRIIKDVQPKFAVMENVANLVSKKFKKDFDTMLDELDKAGYRNYWQVINALDVNFPQHRERVFIVSIRKDIEMKYKFPEKQELTRSFTELLETDWNRSLLHTDKGIAYMNRVTTKGRTHWDFGHHNDTNDMYCHCVTKNFMKGVPYNVLIDRRSGEPLVRKHSPLEVMRLMGFEDNDCDKLKNGRISDYMIYQVAGNSIVVDVCRELLNNLVNVGCD